MTARLTVEVGTAGERSIVLADGWTTVGRTADNKLSITHKSLSRNHARIYVDGERVVLVDLGSTNGTAVDGASIEGSCVLGRRHTLRFGEVEVLFEHPAPSPAPSSSPPTASPEPPVMQTTVVDFSQLSLGELLDAPKAKERDRLRILLKVSQLLSSPAPVAEVLTAMLSMALQILDVDRASVVMIDPVTGELHVRAFQTRKPGAKDVPYSRSVARFVIEKGTAAVFADAGADPRLRDAGSVVMQAIKTTMAAPLLGKNGTLGVLYVDRRTRLGQVGEDDLELLSAFASQAAVAIENAMLHERLAKEASTRQGLLRFFPPAALPLLMNGDNAGLAIVEVNATALFSDISGYTELSSKLRPIEVMQLLNEYFPPMAEIVFRHEGTLEKYIGDALLAVWGAPLKHDDDPLRAVRAAVDMQRAVVAMNARFAGRHSLAIHIGINTGVVAAGNIGSADYLQYATIGDATNVAARVCGVASAGEIAVDAVTAEAAVAAGYVVTDLGLKALKGKDEPLRLFRVDWTNAP